jgi:carboxyl-terminal processing protease
VDAIYMLDSTTGYIKVSRFAATTIEEFEKALLELRKQGMKDLVLDLQGNGGGYMGAAIGICDHLLSSTKLIVYTEGMSSGKRGEYSTYAGMMQEGRVVVLIDFNSASASEIVSGAVQDWDRGVIVGQRSFGKGLVQRQFPLTDGSMIRLTTAHYYTPSGRCIQKPYNKGESVYREEVYNRFQNGELLHADSIVINDSLKYLTKVKGRVVYGGGGIIPDVFVPVDTNINYRYLNFLIAKNVIGEFMGNYIDKNRKSLERKYSMFEQFKQEYTIQDAMIDELVQAGEKAGIPKDEKALSELLPAIKLQLKAIIARDLWDMNEMYQILNEEDKMVKRGLEVLKDGTYENILN